MQAINSTPFAAENIVHVDRDGREQLILVVKATFAIPPGNDTTVEITEQRPIEPEDEWVGEAGASSVRYEADLGMVKTRTDIVLIGHACAEHTQQTQIDVGIRIGSTGKLVRVFGDRFWQHGTMDTRISSPRPFERIPLVYERAFGGTDQSHDNPQKHEFEPRNPVGRGFRASSSMAAINGTALPNLENPSALLRSVNDRPPPCGLGFIGAHWQPRRRYQGTYDDDWKKHRMPLLPRDFDDRFHNSASPGLTCPDYLTGGEPVVIIGATPDGRRSFLLPRVSFRSTVCVDAEVIDLPLSLNTVIADTDTEELVLVWRGSISIHKRTEDVRWTQVELDKSAGFVRMGTA